MCTASRFHGGHRESRNQFQRAIDQATLELTPALGPRHRFRTWIGGGFQGGDYPVRVKIKLECSQAKVPEQGDQLAAGGYAKPSGQLSDSMIGQGALAGTWRIAGGGQVKQTVKEKLRPELRPELRPSRTFIPMRDNEAIVAE